jgi:hypothetical protein
MTKKKDLSFGRIVEPDLRIDAEVFIAAENGWFYTTKPDGSLARQSETLAGLRTALRDTEIKRRRESTRVKIPVTILGRDGDGSDPRAVWLTGLTKGSRRYGGTEVLIKEQDGQQVPGRIKSYTTVYREFTSDEFAAYVQLVQAEEAATKARSQFEKERKLKQTAEQLVLEAQARALPRSGKWRERPAPGEGIPVEQLVVDAVAEVE